MSDKSVPTSGLLAQSESDAHRDICDALVAWAVIFHGAETLQDVLRLGPESLLKTMGLWERTASIDVLGIAEHAAAPLRVGRIFADAMHGLGPRRRDILLRRTFSDDPEILERLGESFGVTRERARQLEADGLKTVRAAVSEAMARAGRRLRVVFGIAAPWDRVLKAVRFLSCDAPDELQPAAELLLLRYAGYSKRGELAVTEPYNELVESAKAQAPKLSDEYGIVDELALKDAVPSDRTDLLEHVFADAGLSRVLDCLVLRDTQRIRVVLALRKIGKPATRDEIAALAGLESAIVGGLLSGSDDIVRVTKNAWGFQEWTDNPYDGTVNEILQRIEEDGGETSVDRLLDEIPSKFGISPGTVRAYLATEKFEVRGGRVRVASADQVVLRPLSQLRDIVWDESGRPVLRIRFEERYANGISVKVPREVVNHLGVGLDESVEVEVQRPERCQAASVIWRAHDPNGPEIGRLSEAFARLNPRQGEDVFIVLDPSGLEVTEDASGFSPEPPRSRDTRESYEPEVTGPPIHSEAFERIKARRRLLDS